MFLFRCQQQNARRPVPIFNTTNVTKISKVLGDLWGGGNDAPQATDLESPFRRMNSHDFFYGFLNINSLFRP